MLVYPNTIDIDFSPVREPKSEWQCLREASGLAQGVLTITVCGVKLDNKGFGGKYWTAGLAIQVQQINGLTFPARVQVITSSLHPSQLDRGSLVI